MFLRRITIVLAACGLAFAGVQVAAASAMPVAKCTSHGRNSGPAGSSSGTAHERIERVIAAGRSMTGRGLSYSWGAGGKGGPSCGIAERSPGGYWDYDRFGFDCSGLTLYAFWKGAGVNIGDTAAQQYRNGKKIDREHMRRGDLIFWKTKKERIVHVAIYLGNGKILESSVPRGTTSVHVTTLRTSRGGDVITDHAVRFIA